MELSKDKTYSQVMGVGEFDWRAFLSKECYTYGELYDARIFASRWVSCACGNQCSIIPRMFDGSPKDDELRRLGINFHERVKQMCITHSVNRDSLFLVVGSARQILEDIEIRSTKLIHRILNEQEN